MRLIDTTFRDGQQSNWATRMRTAWMLPVAEAMDEAGFAAIDSIAQVQIDVCVRFLKENPWERLRLLRQRIVKTPLRAWMRGKGFSFTDTQPDDLIELWIERLVANGARNVVAFDGLNDLENLGTIVRKTKALGVKASAAVAYSVSPVHTDELYVRTASGLARMGVDSVLIKDSGALMTPERFRQLVPKMKAVLPGIELEFHGHCSAGLATLLYAEAPELGVDIVHTAIPPLADGVAQPSVFSVVRNLHALGEDPGIDLSKLEEPRAFLIRVAHAEGKPAGEVQDVDLTQLQHQLPGGMLSNFRASLQEAGMLHRLDEVVEECIRIRQELGWPMLITPYAQIVGTQAVMNVMRGDRYGVVPDVLKKYALGYYGKPLAPVDPDVLDKIVQRGSPTIAVVAQPQEPQVLRLRERYPDLTDDDRLLMNMFAGDQVAQMQAAPPIDTHYVPERPYTRVLHHLLRRTDVQYARLQRGDDVVELSA
jgi:oxaloacetate decarboxylase alpha subunit